MSRPSFFHIVQSLERGVGLEHIHFSHPPTLAFPAQEVLAVRHDESGDAHVVTALLGLLGHQSPLPAATSEEVLFEDPDGHLQAFFDVFQGRALELLYLSWKRFAPSISTEETFQASLLSLMGIDAFSAEQRVSDVAPSFSLGLSDFARCEPGFLDGPGLEQILARSYPALNARVGQGDPALVEAHDEDRTCLGMQNSTMGIDAGFGSGALDLQGALRITVGPVDGDAYEDLMPGGALYGELARFVDHWTASRVVPELEVLLGENAPATCLDVEYGAALGLEARFAGAPSAAANVRVPLIADAGAAGSITRRYIHD